MDKLKKLVKLVGMLLVLLLSVASADTIDQKNQYLLTLNGGLYYTSCRIIVQDGLNVVEKPGVLNEFYEVGSSGISPRFGFDFQYIKSLRFGAKINTYTLLSSDMKYFDFNFATYVTSPTFWKSHIGIALGYHRIFFK